jgi:hypothetical protein
LASLKPVPGTGVFSTSFSSFLSLRTCDFERERSLAVDKAERILLSFLISSGKLSSSEASSRVLLRALFSETAAFAFPVTVVAALNKFEIN